MTKVPTNIGASVRARLLKLAKERREDYQLLLTSYANERFLHRLSISEHASSFLFSRARPYSRSGRGLPTGPRATSISSDSESRQKRACERSSKTF